MNVATHDLACDRVDVSEVSEGKYAAYGCGRGAVYTELCEGGSCRWGRLRHGHESSIAASQRPLTAEPREVPPAPAPQPRQVIPAPAPQPREVIPAPPPASATPGGQPGSSGLQPGLQPGEELEAAAPQPLTAGDLSAPYQTEVPPYPTEQQTTVPPPVPLVETRPLPPARNHVWISGYWWWGPSAYWVWAPGYWCPPYYGFNYIPGGWYWGGGYWRYGPGGWARPGTTVIVHRNFPPRPTTVATTRAFTPHRVTRTAAATGSGQRGAQAPARFQPRASPLSDSNRVSRPGATSASGRASPSRFGADGVGRVVAPGSTARPRSDYARPSNYSSSRGNAPSRSYSGGSSAPSRSYSGGGSSSRGSFSRPPPSSSRSSGGSFRGGGGGGRSFGGGGGGGGSRGGMAPARVSPGGGGGGGRRGR